MAVASDVSSSSSWLKFFQRQRDAHEEDEQLFSKARRLLSSPFSRVADRQPPTTFPKALVQAAVRRLYERGKFIGTFVFVGEHIGVCSFHCVSDSQQIKQEGLTVDGRALIHIISYPYYDMSFFLVDGEEIHQYLRLYSSDSLEQGSNVVLVAYPDIYGSELVDGDEADIAYGRVRRYQSIRPDSPFNVADYTSFPGCSGGAVVTEDGMLLGVHMESIFYEAPKLRRGGASWFCLYGDQLCQEFLESSIIKYPNLDRPKGRRVYAENQKLNREDVETLARYSAINVQHKSCVASFLPVKHIRLRLLNAKRIVVGEIQSIQV